MIVKRSTMIVPLRRVAIPRKVWTRRANPTSPKTLNIILLLKSTQPKRDLTARRIARRERSIIPRKDQRDLVLSTILLKRVPIRKISKVIQPSNIDN
jgi:hypothetical protein